MVALHTAFTAAVRVIHRVHRHAAHRWTLSVPTRAARFPVGDIFMIHVTELPDRGHAIDAELPGLARGQLDQGGFPFLAQQLRRATSRANHLAALAGKQFQVVNHGAGRNVPELHRVPGKNVRALAVLHRHADFETHRLQDVALLAVGIMQQRDARRAVRVVFDRGHLGRDSRLVPAEVDRPVALGVATAAMPRRDFSVGIAAAGALLRFRQGLFRRLLGDLALIEHGQEAPRRCVRFKCF